MPCDTSICEAQGRLIFIIIICYKIINRNNSLGNIRADKFCKINLLKSYKRSYNIKN